MSVCHCICVTDLTWGDERSPQCEKSHLLIHLSSGTMTRRTAKRQRSGWPTGPCCPTSVRQVVSQTQHRRTASSQSAGWRVWTLSEELALHVLWVACTHTDSGASTRNIFLCSICFTHKMCFPKCIQSLCLNRRGGAKDKARLQKVLF